MLATLSLPAVSSADISGRWVVPGDSDTARLLSSLTEGDSFSLVLRPGNPPARTGGVAWYEQTVQLDDNATRVLDFRNSSVIGRFDHWVLNADQRVVARLTGGLSTPTPDEYLLRHAREITLPAGEYRILSRLDSPFFLARPEPYLMDREEYARASRYPTVFVLVGIGVFVALAFYYAAMGLWRRSAADLLYVAFILGNLLYNASALLVVKALAGSTWFYAISVPILISNVLYVAFVMCLLRINRQTHPRLYRLGIGVVTLLVLGWPLALAEPSWSLEICRYGVALFALYGLVAGVARSLQGDWVARWYLVANLSFFVPAMVAISLQDMPLGDVVLIEHLGLLAVLLEVLLLALVMSYQVGLMQRDRERQIRRLEQARLLDDLARQVPGVVFRLQQDAANRFSAGFVSPGVQALFALSPEAVVADVTRVIQRVHPEDRGSLHRSLMLSGQYMEPWQYEFRVHLPNTVGWGWRSVTAHPERQRTGETIWHGFVADVTARREAERSVREQAEHDPLTGALNRNGLNDFLEHEVLRCQQKGERELAVLFLDLDHFKPVNDQHGHATGDQVLQEVARRLMVTVRDSDRVARFGGDEFVVILSPVKGKDAALSVAGKLQKALLQPVSTDTMSITVSVSLGVALGPEHGTTPTALLEAADQAMYAAKRDGRDRISVFDPALGGVPAG